jgi:hypothetical protein
MSNASQGCPGWWGRHPDLWYYDRLPPAARAALANAAFDWSSGAIYGQWRRGKPGFQTGPDIATKVAAADARQIAKDRKRVWKIAE